MKATTLNKLIAVAALAVGTSLFAADAPAPSKPADKSVAKPAVPSSGDVKADMEKFNAQRDAMLSQHQALVNQLKSATAEQRKAILEKMKEIGDVQRELSKQIRDDLRKLRQGQGSPGRG
jgi:hypothetical protein